MSHTCHATGCGASVQPKLFMCKRHWYMLPLSLRKDIWLHYRPGQEDSKVITHGYANAARAAVRCIANKERREPDLRLYDMLDPGPGGGS